MGGSNRPGPVIKLAAVIYSEKPAQVSQVAALQHESPEPGNGASPFELANESAYLHWRAEKLRLRASLPATRVFELGDGLLDTGVRADLAEQLDAFGFFVWQSSAELSETGLLNFNQQFGLHRIDANIGAGEHAVTCLQVVAADDKRSRYIPYSNRGLNWHTDGYYNAPQQRIRAFCLYCVNPAAEGGDSFLFDQELLYILLRDQNPELIAALMAADALSIPANEAQGEVIREVEQGPVFSAGLTGKRLHMRYSTRPKNIIWKQQPELLQALELIKQILNEHEGRVELKLQRKQGVLTNNVLHGRTAFSDGEIPRLMYRARYYDEIDFSALAHTGAVS